MAVAACRKLEIDHQFSEQEHATFTASVESFDSQTKTFMTPEKHVVWSQNDRLAIFQGSTLADEYKVTDESAGKTNGTFSIVSDGSSLNGDFSAGTELPCNVAFYPYADGLSLAGAALENEGVAYSIDGVVLPAEQTYAEGSFANGAFPMAAVTETMADHNLKFKNVLGALKLQLKGSQTVKSIKVTGKSGEVLSGAAVVTVYSNNLTPAITMTATDEASKSVTLNCGDGVQLSTSTATDFIIALPPVLFSQGFIVTMTDDESETYTITADVANTVLRSSVLTMPEVVLGDEVTEEGDDMGTGVKVLDIAFDKYSLTLAPSTSNSLITVVVPDTADDKTLTWSSSSPSVAIVDQSGIVTAVSDGTATITAVAVGGASKSCTVNVISLPASATATKDYIDEYGENHGKGIAIGATVWAPVNCGYKAPTIEDGATTDKGFPYGKLYQWGRRYGQGYSADSDSEPSTFSGPVSVAIGQATSLESYIITCSFDWVDTPDDAMWNAGAEEAPVKAANDPCPNGWRVPTYNELNALGTDYSDWTTDDGQSGYYFSGVSKIVYDTYPLTEDKPQVFFPAAGLYYSDAEVAYRGSSGYYWSSKPYGSREGTSLNFSSSVGMSSRHRACGYSVRCVQE